MKSRRGTPRTRALPADRGSRAVYKRLKIIIPVAQVLIYSAVFVLKLASHVQMVRMDYEPLWRLARSVNYPLWLVFLAIAYPISWLLSPSLTGEWVYIGAIAVLVLFLLGVALFWYVVVTEVEMRSQGMSNLRFSGWFKELLAVTIIFLLGAGAFVRAYDSGRTILAEQRWYVGLGLAPSRAFDFLSMLILTGWAIILVGLALHDFVGFIKRRESQGQPGDCTPQVRQ